MKRTYPVKSVKLWGAKGLDQEGLTIYVLLWGTKWVEIIRKAFVHSIHHSANLQVNCTRIGYYLPAQNVKKDFFELTELLYFPLRKKIYQNLWVGSTSSCWKLELCDKKTFKSWRIFQDDENFFLDNFELLEWHLILSQSLKKISGSDLCVPNSHNTSRELVSFMPFGGHEVTQFSGLMATAASGLR